jgi:hypothetical protein
LERRSAKNRCRIVKFAAALEIDTPMYSKIKRDDRAKQEQITVIAQLLQTEEDMLVSLWIADKIIATGVGKRV